MAGIATHDTRSSDSLPPEVAARPESPVRLHERARELVIVLPLGALLPGDLFVRILDGALWVGPARKPARGGGRMIGWRVPLPPEAANVPRRIRTGPGRIEVVIPRRVVRGSVAA